MPRQAQNSTRCVYGENGRQCRRQGTGTPPLCNAHRIAFQQQAHAPRGRGDALFDFVDSLLDGRPISKKKVRSAIHDLRDLMRDQPGPTVDVPTPPPNRPPPSPPPTTDELELRRRKFREAKIVMGFAESEPITAEMVNQRRKELARRHHPDLGGSVEQMTKINAAADFLLSQRKRRAA